MDFNKLQNLTSGKPSSNEVLKNKTEEESKREQERANFVRGVSMPR